MFWITYHKLPVLFFIKYYIILDWFVKPVWYLKSLFHLSQGIAQCLGQETELEVDLTCRLLSALGSNSAVEFNAGWDRYLGAF